jgi:hypothetical protein
LEAASQYKLPWLLPYRNAVTKYDEAMIVYNRVHSWQCVFFLTLLLQELTKYSNLTEEDRLVLRVAEPAQPTLPAPPKIAITRNFMLKLSSSIRLYDWQREDCLRKMVNNEFKTEDKGEAHVDRYMACNGCEWAFVSAWNHFSGVSHPLLPSEILILLCRIEV